MDKFEVNGKEYRAVDLDFYFLAYLNKCGVQESNITSMAAIGCFLSYCSGMSEKEASDEISQHVINNKGEFPQDLINVYQKTLAESGFFRAILDRTNQTGQETEEENTEETPKKRTTKKSVTE